MQAFSLKGTLLVLGRALRPMGFLLHVYIREATYIHAYKLYKYPMVVFFQNLSTIYYFCNKIKRVIK